MCVAGLNASTQPCAHRWYQLVRACHPANNLANCPERLKLEGWETRVDYCPFCTDGAAQMISESTHRLFGSTSSSVSVASSSNLSDMINATRSRRSASSGTIRTLSRQSSMGSGVSSEPEINRGQMHREMNDRLLLYLTNDPHNVLPSARKNYPTYSSSPESSSSPSDSASIISNGNSLFTRNWTKGVRFGKNMFRT